MSLAIQPADLGFFSVLATAGSLGAAARELAISTSAVSKRLAQMEARLGMVLINRTTRRMSLTPEGKLYVEHARRILGEIDDLEQLLGIANATPSGLLRVNATPVFGRRHVAPAISRFIRKHRQIEVQLRLSVQPPSLADDVFDVCIRYGAAPDTRVIARLLFSNRRVMCAAPAYLAEHGEPKVPGDLSRHNCIGIHEGEEAYGIWRLANTHGRARASPPETVKTRGDLSTNDGEIAVNWALEGHGIVVRSEWDVAHHLRDGRLVELLPQYRTPDADLYAVYPQRHQLSARVRAFVDFMAATLLQADAGAQG
jgi:LysR family transcriptional activator of dmlA